MKEDPARPVALGYTVTKPDILAEVERGEEAAAASGHYREHQSPGPRMAPAGPSQGDWLGKEVKSEEGVSPPPGSPPSHRTGSSDFSVPLQERGCSYCGVSELELNPGVSNGGFITSPPTFESRRCRPGEPLLECAECGRGFGQKPDLVRHRLVHSGERAYACGRCGRGFTEPVGLGATGGPCRPAPCAGRSSGTAEGTTAAPRKERKELSLTEKVRVLEMLEGPKVSQNELAKRFGVSQPQICRIIKNKERILSEWHRNGDPERKRKREGKDVALEAALLRWVEGARTTDLPVSRPLLQLKAKHLAEALGQPDPEPSSGRLARFGTRNNLAFKKPLLEKGDAEQPTAEHWASAVLPGLLRSYTPSEIYACGETAVLNPASSPGESTSDRLTLLLCTNANGSEKAPLRAVGESPQPRCLRGVNLGQMPWSYRASSLASMTASLFAEWLREFNEGMRRQGKCILLLLSKHEAHPYLQLSNVRMVFIPPATTLVQPLDRGIASDLKGHYRRRLLRWLPAERGVGQPTLLDVLHMLAQAWGDVHPGHIASCFRAAGFSPDASTEAPARGLLSQEQLERRTLRDKELERDGEPADGDEGAADGEDGGELAAVQPCPSEREVWRSLATLRRYLECQATSPDLFQAFYELEDAVHMLSAGAGQALTGDNPPRL
ncbi:tigger transposable element-derived protein 3-like [Strigops habroptila]|uniref:Tigger transposable element derived 3 n=1 Tax=Strigops habroptila TaxID=2489341 RepID=A0A672TZ82_STRHB|nr:tigger transposable element-derived protein 3-like [Strigops habroptila]